MAQINVTINGRSFRMACDDGEEERLIGLARRFDGCIDELRRNFGEIGDQRLTVMAGIMVTDELAEMEKKVKALESELAATRDARAAALDHMNRSEADLVAKIDDAARRIETLAEGLNRSLRQG
ncbi:cell division protein ZapA [Polymorphum gilvum]|uniref:Cell division protein ZapA n=1 Tax=Polymorphum gilvum (strain LMG 25793 / CGMCC 1.9160 / SL003B-26A1) TaxID=991905 RepID=F2IX49_POLGS|nr:cell division protein ZapA [Polymorphum gilvum]ADZ69340.1 Cytoplasmic protein [Polymorphum gilvum SL003B-26A1]